MIVSNVPSSRFTRAFRRSGWLDCWLAPSNLTVAFLRAARQGKSGPLLQAIPSARFGLSSFQCGLKIGACCVFTWLCALQLHFYAVSLVPQLVGRIDEKMSVKPGQVEKDTFGSYYEEVLDEAAKLSKRYLKGIAERHSGERPEAIHGMSALGGPLPMCGENALSVLNSLDCFGSPATVASMSEIVLLERV
jgi:hypothetical protein